MNGKIAKYWWRLTSPLEAAQSALKEKRWEEAVQHYGCLRRYSPDDWRGYGEACVAYRQLGRWEQADGVIEAGLAKLGEVKELLIAYGDTAMDQQHWEEALKRWARLRAAHPDESRAWVRAAQALLEQDQLIEAQQLLAQGMAQLGERDELTQAQQAIEARVQAEREALQEAKQQGRWEAALEHCERLRRYSPDDWRGYGEACVAYRQLGRWEQADGVIEAGLAKLGEVKELLIAYGDTAMDQQHWEEALKRWARLRAAHPDESRAWVRAAQALLEQDQLIEAQQLLAQGMAQLGERDELTQAQQAIEARVQAEREALQEAKQQGRWEAALEHCERLRRYSPDDWRGYGEACVAYRQLGRWEQADGVIEAGLAKLGEVKELLIAYGDTAMDQQHWDEALTRWERLRATHSDESRAWVRAAQALLEQDQLIEAQQLLAQGMAQLGEREELAQAQQAIEARVQAVRDALQEAKQQGRWEAALEHCERLRRYAPDDWRGYGEACVAYRQLGRWDQADGVIEAGLAKLGEVKELLIAYGDNAMDQQHWEEALKRWERLRAAHPDEKKAYERALEAHLELGQISAAKRLTESWEADHPGDGSLRFTLTMCSMRKELSDATTPIQRMLPDLPILNPDLPDVVVDAQVYRRALKIGLTPLSRGQVEKICDDAGADVEEKNLQIAEKIVPGSYDQFHGLRIDLTSINAKDQPMSSYLYMFRNCKDLLIENLDISYCPANGIFIGGSRNVIVRNCIFRGIEGAAIVIGESSSRVTVENCLFIKGKGAAIWIGEASHKVRIRRNHIRNGQGKSNWKAGIVVTDRSLGQLIDGPRTFMNRDDYWAKSEPISRRLDPPCDIVIEENEIVAGLSSGIYLDGAIHTLVLNNLLRGNSKEGICLDYGASANLVAFNTISGNGNRWGKTDQDLKLDFVLSDGRMPDGTARAKVPGVSIDNAIYNVVCCNQVAHNYGSGIKIVRSGYANAITENAVLMNGLGGNSKHTFFGIELGYANSDTPLDSYPELDFFPSLGNLVSGNKIKGFHFANIFELKHGDNMVATGVQL